MAERVLTRVHSLRERLDETLSANRNEILALLSRFVYKTFTLQVVVYMIQLFVSSMSDFLTHFLFLVLN